MADSGAMVSCMTQATLAAFPAFQKHFHAAPDLVKGVGDISCKVLGEVRDLAISLGETQEPGSIYFATFRVTQGESYTIILGLDILHPMHAEIRIVRK